MNENKIFISANFNSSNTVDIGYVFLTTNEQKIIKASNGKINLLQGRLYYIPTDADKTIDSDNYNIKVPSEIAERFDIRFIKDGFAAVIPVKHNAILKTGERLCILTSIV
ncbi:MAG: hypothetical protein PHD05_00490 [Sphaerochaetaceae bacterium]|jgi:hypothetical protein|nr:hypothetical protein [Sphaerochaetaceae bacterium]